jgi:transposase-like protein
MKKRERRTFTDEFKQAAAKRVAGGEHATVVAADIGVSLNSLRSWKEKPLAGNNPGWLERAEEKFPPKERDTNLRQENELLKAENEYLKHRVAELLKWLGSYFTRGL